MTAARIGSLFSGYGGLELGISSVLNATTAWHVEHEDAPSRILAHHWPAVPNYGDITATDWAAVEPVDILCGGFPCQDVSQAGLRRGLKPDTRSGLWSHFALAIDRLRPSLVLIENVRGLLSAEAHSAVEPDPWDLGTPGRPDRPTLRALGAVLGDLADLGYDAEWLGLRAADAGAPHGRFRVFIVAQPADPDGLRSVRPASPGPAERTRPPYRRLPAPDTDGGRYGQPEDARGMGRLDSRDASSARERERARTLPRDRSAPDAADPGRVARDPRRESRPGTPPSARPLGDPRGRGAWGDYGPAIWRWERTLGRLAPSPTERTRTGGERLSPRFVEWMMGLPPGHVTDPAVGLTRSEQLKALGNGVVPQQAALALSTLLKSPPVGSVANTNARPTAAAYNLKRNPLVSPNGHGDDGGASRFFKIADLDYPFRYTAKAPGSERPSADGIAHPTVKPLDVMRWLIRLVTPPGGTVLEPFSGSGSTVEAAVLEGFHVVGIEREADYLPLILQRIHKPHAVGLDFGDWEP